MTTYLNSPIYGDSACPLCENHETPFDLNTHLTETKTCGDAHLELSLFTENSNPEKCASAQEAYRPVCCVFPESQVVPVETKLQVGAAAIAGAFILWFVSNKVLSVKVGVANSAPTKTEEDTAAKYNRMEDAPKMQKSTSKTRRDASPKKSKSLEEELPQLQVLGQVPSQEMIEFESPTGTGHKAEDEDESMMAMWNGSNS